MSKVAGVNPTRLPIGLHLTRTARVVGRAYDEALAQAGGSLPVWLVLLNLKIRVRTSQRELASAVGIREATLTHHLNAMEAQGLITRARDPANRRVHVVALTDDGTAAFLRLRAATVAFDQRLREGLSDEQVATAGTVFARLAANAGATAVDAAAPPCPDAANKENTGEGS
jgi:MarR family transcriptional regulator for hemolysin